MYKIKLQFKSMLTTSRLAILIQRVYDDNGVAGTFDITTPEQVGVVNKARLITFERNEADDAEYIHSRLPDGDFSDLAIMTAVGEQLLAELSQFDSGRHMDQIIQALKDNNFEIEGIDALRPPVVFEMGDRVFVRSEQKLATVLDVYGDGVNGDQGDIRLDLCGNTPISDIEKYDSVKHAEFETAPTAAI